MQINRDQFLEDGYLVLRQIIPPGQLDSLRVSYEHLVKQQKVIWAEERPPNAPPGGVWETSAQPRLLLQQSPLANLIDRYTASAIEIWLHPNTQGISSELLDIPDAAVTEMMLMCSPVSDRGPAVWHRDLHPIDTAPLQGYIDDIIETGPRYIQWNIPLYDDSVLWVVPGSHLRLNTGQENKQLLADPRVPLSDGIQTHLKAGDGVVYILPILHWGSNYSTKTRRTIHGGFSNHTQYPNLDFVEHLKTPNQQMFENWEKRSIEMQNHTEAALRAAIKQNSHDYHSNLEKLCPGRKEKGKMLTTIFLSKMVCFINLNKTPNFGSVSDDLRQKAPNAHPTTLNWGPKFADRFSVEEARILWNRFKIIEAKLKTNEEHFSPGFQSGPMHYFFNQMPTDFNVTDLIASWSKA